MSDQNWRTGVDAQDYFTHRQKQANVADRRPVIRRASSLVGPGIGAYAVRLANLNDVLASFNGYYSAAQWTPGAPIDSQAFVGYVLSDADLGGVQVFTSLYDGAVYQRVFTRSPSDPSTIDWTQAWTAH